MTKREDKQEPLPNLSTFVVEKFTFSTNDTKRKVLNINM